MRVKVFQIMCNSKKLLSAEVIAEALLKQVTLKSHHPNNFFAVMESSRGKVVSK